MFRILFPRYPDCTNHDCWWHCIVNYPLNLPSSWKHFVRAEVLIESYCNTTKAKLKLYWICPHLHVHWLGCSTSCNNMEYLNSTDYYVPHTCRHVGWPITALNPNSVNDKQKTTSTGNHQDQKCGSINWRDKSRNMVLWITCLQLCQPWYQTEPKFSNLGA